MSSEVDGKIGIRNRIYYGHRSNFGGGTAQPWSQYSEKRIYIPPLDSKEQPPPEASSSIPNNEQKATIWRNRGITGNWRSRGQRDDRGRATGSDRVSSQKSENLSGTSSRGRESERRFGDERGRGVRSNPGRDRGCYGGARKVHKMFECDIEAALEGKISDESMTEQLENVSWSDSADEKSAVSKKRSVPEPGGTDLIAQYPTQPGFRPHHYRFRITHVESAENFHVVSISKQPVRIDSHSLRRYSSLTPEALFPGRSCVVLAQGSASSTSHSWNRAKVLSKDLEVRMVILVYLVDYGTVREIAVPKSGPLENIKPLPPRNADQYPLAYQCRLVGGPAAELERAMKEGLKVEEVLQPGWVFKVFFELDEPESEEQQQWSICSIKPDYLCGRHRPMHPTDFAELCDILISERGKTKKGPKAGKKTIRVVAREVVDSSIDSDEEEFIERSRKSLPRVSRLGLSD